MMRDTARVRTSPLNQSLCRHIVFFALATAAFATLADLRAQAPQQSSEVLAAQKEPAAQTAPDSRPIAIVPLDTTIVGHALEVTGDLKVSNGRAVIAANGTVVSGGQATHVTLPYRGTLLVCAYTTVKLTADSSAPAGDAPGLLMAIDYGAVELSFAARPASRSNADILLTPDFRVLIGGPGAADVNVRLGPQGDTCIDNAGANAPYVLVSSVFDGGAYRVQPGQRVMFQHGSLHEVVDQEKESCGCPPAQAKGNEFPVAQSEGLAPMAAPAAAPEADAGASTPPVAPLVYKGADHTPQPATTAPASSTDAKSAPAQPAPQKKPGFFKSIGRFFKRIFGAE